MSFWNKNKFWEDCIVATDLKSCMIAYFSQSFNPTIKVTSQFLWLSNTAADLLIFKSTLIFSQH